VNRRNRPGLRIAALPLLGYPCSTVHFSGGVQVATRSGTGVPIGAFTLIFLLCLGLLGFGEYLQHWRNLDPCPWCIAQRLHYVAIALVALVAALHRPGPGGTIAYAVFGALFALSGMAAAGYHIYVQSDPKRAAACIGGWLENLLDASKVGKALPLMLQYDGACTPKDWNFFGFSIPELSLAWFVILFAVFCFMMVKARR